mgnify:FL=1|tara:strand:+ start:8647 stop:9996 length:1350 start_codon:yes stop_codon:yes gene_type:complete
MDDKTLKSLSPLDGRYFAKTKQSRALFSEHALIEQRLKVEVFWLKYFLENFKPDILNEAINIKINQLCDSIPNSMPMKVKEIEKITNHDVKAVELALAEEFEGHPDVQSLIHIFLTSEDVNSASYALMLLDANSKYLAWIESIYKNLQNISAHNDSLAMVARTHGQPASPTTLGKEMNVFATRLKKEIDKMEKTIFYAKWGGATANYNPHLLAYPNEDWVEHSESFLNSLNLRLTKVSTQIEPHDYMADLFHSMQRTNNILLDLTKDIWSYISFDYFKLKITENEVGSSTMPHKVNPIDFENAEGNLGMANAILHHLADKLVVSRLQRDLSDSTVLRNIGTAYGYIEIAANSIDSGLQKLEPNKEVIKNDLDERYELLAEALQSFLRLEGKVDGYESVKKLSRGQKMDKSIYLKAVDKLIENEEHKTLLNNLTPSEYVGMASKLAKETK